MVTKPLYHITTCVLMTVMSLLFSQTVFSKITVMADRNPVQLNESFQLIFTTDESVSRQPDFSLLKKNFEILNQRQSSNMSIINGSMNSQKTWTLTIMAKQAGNYTIPSINFGAGKKSKPLRLTVNRHTSPSLNNQNNDLFIEVATNSQQARIQEQIIYTIKLFSAISLSTISFSEPESSNHDDIIIKLDDDKQYETKLKGRHYIVVERRYAIYPQRTGKLTIKPITLNAELVKNSRRSMFGSFGGKIVNRRLKSKKIELKIRNIPKNYGNAPWLPSRKVTLQESWPQKNQRFSIGEAITRSVTLTAEGIPASQLPKISLPLPDSLKQYADKPTIKDTVSFSGITGARQEKNAIIPSTSGTYTLPKIEIPWWNTEKNKKELAIIPERTITIKAPHNQKTLPPGNPPTTPAQSTELAIETNPASSSSISTSNKQPLLSLLVGVIVGWVTALIFWMIFAKGKQSTVPLKKATNSNEPSSRELTNRLQRACSDNNAKEAKHYLTKWLDLGSNSVPQALLDQLNQAIYDTEPEAWNGESLWQAILSDINSKKKMGQTTNDLAPLNPE